MPEGVNYFWVSIQMKPSTSLDTRISAAVSEIRIDGNAVPIQSYGRTEVRRMGAGVRYAGDDGVAAYRIPGLATIRKGGVARGL